MELCGPGVEQCGSGGGAVWPGGWSRVVQVWSCVAQGVELCGPGGRAVWPRGWSSVVQGVEQCGSGGGAQMLIPITGQHL